MVYASAPILTLKLGEYIPIPQHLPFLPRNLTKTFFRAFINPFKLYKNWITTMNIHFVRKFCNSSYMEARSGQNCSIQFSVDEEPFW